MFLVAAVLVGGVPLVAHALTDDVAAERVLAASPTPVPFIETVPLEGSPKSRTSQRSFERPRAQATVAPASSVAPLPDVVAPGPSADQWAAMRDCESGGDYSITNPSGKYRGAYQFDRSTWNSVAERHAPALVGVDPAAASPADQDAMALALYSERGARPWPHCGRHLG